MDEVRISDAMACLPDEVGSWPRRVLEIIASHGDLRTFRPQDLREATGWCLATCRQRLEEVSWLLSVINAIALNGHITSIPGR